MENARLAADRTSDCRNWALLTLQVQPAAERTAVAVADPPLGFEEGSPLPTEDPDCEGSGAKLLIRAEIGEIPFV
jgi:hypothetical protein